MHSTPTASLPKVEAGPAPRRGIETLLIVATASVLSSLDLFVVNLAFSSLHASFPGTTNQQLSWVLAAYSIAFAALLVPAGRLADRHGKKQVFRIGLAVFGLASAACALAPNVAVLIAARAAKGIGAAMMVPTSLGLLLSAYPRERHTQMVALWGATGSIAAALGPVLGGVLVDLSWRLIFLINVPLAALAVWRSAHLVDHQNQVAAERPDLLGSALLALGIGALVAAISYGPEWGFASAPFLLATASSVALIGSFLWRCLHHPVPALDLRMFRAPGFVGATLGMSAFYMGFAMMLLGGTLFLTNVWGWSALRAGVAFAAGPATAVLSSLVAGKAGASPKRLVVLGAGCFVAASLWWWTLLGAEPAWLTHYLPASVVFGAGAGLSNTGFLTGGTRALAAADYATGSAVLNTARQIGAAIGVALFVALSGTATTAAQYAPAWLGIGTCAVAGAAAMFLFRERPAMARQNP